MQQTDSDMSELGGDLSMADLDEQLLAMTTATSRRAAGEADVRIARIDLHLAAYGKAQAELIRSVQRLRCAIGGGGQPGLAWKLPVAPLGVPHRVTKRDYNYFDALHAALLALPTAAQPDEITAG
jgi:hypothetical protein